MKAYTIGHVHTKFEGKMLKNGSVIKIGRLDQPKKPKSPMTLKNMKAYTIGNVQIKVKGKMLKNGLVIEIGRLGQPKTPKSPITLKT